jgi:hypothetical protein
MSSQKPLFTLQDIPGKGKGLVATHDIQPGTLLISETPLLTTESLQDANTIEKDLAKIVRGLDKEGQRAFLSLHNNFKGEPNPFSNIVRSNGYPLGPSSDIGGIFPLVSRINHSCRPNAQHAWNEKVKGMLVHVVREIPSGEEITLSYLNGGPSTQRKQILSENFRFECSCELCSLPVSEVQESDGRLRQAQNLDDAIGDSQRVRNSPEQALADCRALRVIYEAEKVFDLRLPRLYYDAFQICAMHGDRARASVFAKRAQQTRSVCEGEGSAEVENLKGLERDPSKFENFGVTMRWRSRLQDVPYQGEGKEEAFGRWLWREGA